MGYFSFIKCLLICGSVTGLTEMINDDGYIGCFLDKPDRILEVRFPDSEENNRYRCKELCKEFRYRYSGTEFGRECYCGDTIEDYGRKPDSECNTTCTGSPDEFCGGLWRISIYNNLEKTTTTTNTITQTSNGHILNGAGSSKVIAYTSPGYLGCYYDGFEIRILRGTFQKLIRNSGKACKEYCKSAGYRFAGTKAGFDCYCGNTIRKEQLADGCYERCPGRVDEFCGGIMEISVYDNWSCATKPCEPDFVCEDLDANTYTCICTKTNCGKAAKETTLQSTLISTTQVQMTKKIELETGKEPATRKVTPSTVNINKATNSNANAHLTTDTLREDSTDLKREIKKTNESRGSSIIIVPVLLMLTVTVAIVIAIVVVKKRRRNKEDDVYHEYHEPDEPISETNNVCNRKTFKANVKNNGTLQSDETYVNNEEQSADAAEGFYEMMQHDSDGEYTTLNFNSSLSNNSTYPNVLYEALRKENQPEIYYSKIKEIQRK